MLTNLREQSSTVVLIDRFIVEYGEAQIWLSEHLASHEFVGSLSNQPPRTLDDAANEIHQLLVIRQEQGTGISLTSFKSVFTFNRIRFGHMAVTKKHVIVHV